VSFDKQNFARTVQEQQGGISPQMWPILCPDNGHLVVDQPYEISINPCDSIWLPATFDKSYGTNPLQNISFTNRYFPNPAHAGANAYDVNESSVNPTPPSAPYLSPAIVAAPLFALRFNSPNNPWLLWGLGNGFNPASLGYWGTVTAGQTPMTPLGHSTLMRSISGPISRLWITYRALGACWGGPTPVGMNQIVLLSSLGYSQSSLDHSQPVLDPFGIFLAPPPIYDFPLSSGGYRSPDLNSADLLALGVKTATTTTSKL
jgi:hypothetical protein